MRQETAETGATPRERYRAQVRAEIKDHARRQIATAGAPGLSLNAIAKRMGMSGPALYRYYAGRDELLTDLVRDAYRSLAEDFRAASAPAPDARALAHALRAWALADPQRYFLTFGTPVPGYEAPEDTTVLAREVMTLMLDACAALPPAGSPGGPFAAHLEEHREWTGGHPAPPAVLHRALTLWTRLHGALSLELAGHFAGMGFDPALLYEAELDALTGDG
ncbi:MULTISPECIES: TetR/AcrR family transcriptional regulator [Streptomyces]|jgi:AcrR family transcriptional regulator|uniref:TetR/AcrR family transcriptional regulator n=3 Tax=Streptomyces griseoaurantiacus TaxID=68213 RepID=A0A1G7FGE1_9ACTN|nr:MULTISPECIES: TetR/AcrR family transcriptional regulator [Streptomyces]MBA5224493.1 TetR/AcrR family transcriptional regulator [Streptomyces griseoaurantiacus]MCF0090992.1 putative HTH-type transcriptional regulator [Streptomyces sp. MH192]MCF0103463.1 putative HTH-type transcriptional regulator [Streptomyces sp. MH191]MDX3092649.1 TetR/AcrR family transcriptional regulator [Streptomyces sp. ME12-02E]MDX3336168.1 TetR/AcrR family transcriptional regulator [Streptomyces sp. ME02-6978a]